MANELETVETGDVLQAVEAELQARHEAAEVEFRRMAEQIASGSKPPKAADIQRALDASGRDVAGLRREVERLQHRAKLKAQLAEAERAEVEVGRLQAKIDAARLRLKAFEEKTAAEVQPLKTELLRLRGLIVAAGSARQQLFDDARQEDPATAERLRDIRRRQNEADLQRQQLQDTRERIVLNIENATAEIKRGSRSAKADLENAQARLQDTDRRIAELDATVAELAEAGNALFRQAAA